MAGSLERRDDGSFALYINGDLQFDEGDEQIYHEALALPALALATKRIQSPLKVLVIGGGDGLVAREIFKSSQVASLDLVDYDPEILNLARHDLSLLNEASLNDPRITIHIQDAWDFVEQKLERGASFDLIVSDLTVAEDVRGARFHSVEWYDKLARLLPRKGVLAVNGVSPSATPQAYWSIFNSMLKADLHARPYHVGIPSFSKSGYGQDWGFFMASAEPITVDEIDADLPLAKPRKFLQNMEELMQLFIFPEELFDYQPKSLPALVGSDILLHYFNNSAGLVASSGLRRDAFVLDAKSLFVPDADTGKDILPPDLCTALAKSIHRSEENDSSEPEDVQLFLHEVLDLMPSLERAQTSALIADFLEEPAVFLQAIDLPGLVARLLRRAAELPSQLVAELEVLAQKLEEWADDHLSLLALGKRVVTVLTLAIVVGNLLYPDMVYAKGGAHAAAHGGGHAAGHAGHGANHSAAAGRHATGVHGGRRGYGNGWGGGWNNTYYRRNYVNGVPKGPMGPGPSSSVERDMRKNSLPQRNDVSAVPYIDETGSSYPARSYRTAQATDGVNAVYRLGPGTDILANGHVAMPLTDRSYLLITPHATHVVEQQSGFCAMSLENDADLLSVTIAEIMRQKVQLATSLQSTQPDQAIQSDQAAEDAASAVHYLSQANELFKGVSLDTVSQVTPLVPGAVEVFPSVCATADGKFLEIRRAGGQIAYLDGQNWYSDFGQSPLNEPYPVQFKSIAASYLAKVVRDATATENMLLADKEELTAHITVLGNELTNYESSAQSVVDFGSRQLPREEAIRLTQLAIRKAERQVQTLNKYIEQLPGRVDIARTAMSTLSNERTA